ncbi:Sperm surface protein [Dirofilaria immitis]
MAESSSENYKVPTGLRPLLETLVRETLRIQPTDLISSSLLFFIVFQNHRKQNNAEDVLKDTVLYESFKNDLRKQVTYYEKEYEITGQSSGSLDEAAMKIQAAYRGHALSIADKLIFIYYLQIHRIVGSYLFGFTIFPYLPPPHLPPQHLFPFRFETIQLGLSRTETDIMWPSAKCITSLNAEKDLKSYSVNATGSVVEKDVTEDRAATIIQTEIRSFLTRRHLRQIKKEGNDAARKIQAHIRGYLTRKHLDEVGILHKYSTVSHLHNGLQEHM